MASESYYHPIRECGILVILLLFPVGSKYNGEGQGLMQFISCNSVRVSPLSFNGTLFLNAERMASTRPTPYPQKNHQKNPWDFLHYLHFVNIIEMSKLINKQVPSRLQSRRLFQLLSLCQEVYWNTSSVKIIIFLII